MAAWGSWNRRITKVANPVGEDQLVVRAGSGGPQALMAPTFPQAGFLLGLPWLGQLGDQLAQALAGDTGADPM